MEGLAKVQVPLSYAEEVYFGSFFSLTMQTINLVTVDNEPAR